MWENITEMYRGYSRVYEYFESGGEGWHNICFTSKYKDNNVCFPLLPQKLEGNRRQFRYIGIVPVKYIRDLYPHRPIKYLYLIFCIYIDQ